MEPLMRARSIRPASRRCECCSHVDIFQKPTGYSVGCRQQSATEGELVRPAGLRSCRAMHGVHIPTPDFGALSNDQVFGKPRQQVHTGLHLRCSARHDDLPSQVILSNSLFRLE
ncbi:hypothetical protein [uncultured Piscinibacter sp.]|uniref:hypothetical protein n=1 Tax=uncultured Piscinibacter sp. TaxID=1131835 RepID=UPI0026098F32|nr:hypothetical protein [uncultured Piscinibacter sp.]